MTAPDLTPQEHDDLTECATLLRGFWRDHQHALLKAALKPSVYCRKPGCACQYPAEEFTCPDCGHQQDALVFTPVERPAYRVAFLRREGLGELVVRRAGRVEYRRTFRPEVEVPRGHNVAGPCAACVAARKGQA